jgi:uncharacterized protein YndB with AHSA1/START domain
MSRAVYALEIEPGKQEIIGTRTFDAPRDLVFKTMMDPKLIPQWWGPRAHTTKVDEMDARQGGRWRHVVRDPDGNERAFHDFYHAITAPDEALWRR